MDQKKFETFNDGIAEIYSTDEKRKLDQLIATPRYQEKVIGVTRHYAALSAQEQINLLIRIPQLRLFSEDCKCVIDGYIYEIKQIQHINDTLPKVTDISLKRVGMKS